MNGTGAPHCSRRPAGADAVRCAVAELAAGGMVVVVDDADRENEGDLVVAADAVTPEQVAFLVRHTTGILCAPMKADRTRELRLPQMVPPDTNDDTHGTAFTVSVDHAGCGTGVSAADRARTLAALARSEVRPDELRRPGHVFPLRARNGGVLVRPGHTEAAVDLLRLAARVPVGVIGEIVAPDGSMAAGDRLAGFAAEHDLPVVTVAELVRHRRATERTVEHMASSTMPTRYGVFRALAFRDPTDEAEHLALVLGDVAAAGRSERGALVRVHSECLTGDILGSLRCDCGTQLKQAIRAIAEEGRGAVVYLRGREGRGIGLGRKIRAYALQEQGHDTVEANIIQGLPADARSYSAGAQILAELEIRRLRLMTNNPDKHHDLNDHGLQATVRVPLAPAENRHNIHYLRTKQTRLGHHLDLDLAR